MGRHRKHHTAVVFPPNEKEINLSLGDARPPEPEQVANLMKQLDLFPGEETLPKASVEPPKAIPPAPPPPAPSTYWVVTEERRAALNGALVTVAKGKVVKSAAIAKRLMEQNVPLAEKTQ